MSGYQFWGIIQQSKRERRIHFRRRISTCSFVISVFIIGGEVVGRGSQPPKCSSTKKISRRGRMKAVRRRKVRRKRKEKRLGRKLILSLFLICKSWPFVKMILICSGPGTGKAIPEGAQGNKAGTLREGLQSVGLSESERVWCFWSC